MEPLTRAFVAVPCGEPLRAALSRRLDGREGPAPVRWTRPGNWHVTLQFLGDWPGARLSALRQALVTLTCPDAADPTPAGFGGFPDLERPRVLFLQFQGAAPLADLADQVRRATGAVWPEGPQDTRPFHPHLTLARVAAGLDARQRKALQDVNMGALPPLVLDRVVLMSSRLEPGGARYAELASFALRKKGE